MLIKGGNQSMRATSLSVFYAVRCHPWKVKFIVIIIIIIVVVVVVVVVVIIIIIIIIIIICVEGWICRCRREC